jgi:hypothetical protein
MARTSDLAVNVSYVCGRHKKPFAKQALVADTKPNRQSVKAGKLIRLAGMLGLLWPYRLCFVPATYVLVFVEVDVLQTIMCLAIYFSEIAMMCTDEGMKVSSTKTINAIFFQMATMQA